MPDVNDPHEYERQLAEDLIDQNCIDCPEFLKPLETSCCWCEVIHDLVDQELYRIDCCTQDHEDSVACEWELIRKKISGENMREKITCPLREIPVNGGATLKVHGDFKLCCIGVTCENYPCDEVKKI
jgi:hypothetical protein